MVRETTRHLPFYFYLPADIYTCIYIHTHTHIHTAEHQDDGFSKRVLRKIEEEE